MAFSKQLRRLKIKESISSKISGTTEMPRLSVFRSNKQISVQVIDDATGKTLVSASSLNKEVADIKGNKTQQAEKVGELIAKSAIEKGIKAVVFDRNGYLFHGRVKALAEAAKKEGLKI
ncbi:MAG: 50S ribosomal protein L18 [Salinivirgaceae bacterium]|jgi:large subunit ribosomal protein L18|nr:50S ribosomal protein L18 [Salinivirgaceae bacterium]